MDCEKLSPRQLWVAVLTGGLSAGAAAAGAGAAPVSSSSSIS